MFYGEDTDREREYIDTYKDGMGLLRLISRLLKIVGLFCRISSLLCSSFAKETYNFKEPTNRRHPIDCRQSMSIHRQRHTHRRCSLEKILIERENRDTHKGY